jgi:hypothetical protein
MSRARPNLIRTTNEKFVPLIRRQPADSIRARGMSIPHSKAGYMVAIFHLFTRSVETACQTGERPYMVRSQNLAQGDPVLSTTYSGSPLQWLLDDA